MFMEFMVQASRDKAVWDASIAPFQAYQTLIMQMLNDGKAEGSISPETDEETTAWIMISFAVGVLLQGVVIPAKADWEKVTQTGMGILVDHIQRSDK